MSTNIKSPSVTFGSAYLNLYPSDKLERDNVKLIIEFDNSPDVYINTSQQQPEKKKIGTLKSLKVANLKEWDQNASDLFGKLSELPHEILEKMTPVDSTKWEKTALTVNKKIGQWSLLTFGPENTSYMNQLTSDIKDAVSKIPSLELGETTDINYKRMNAFFNRL